MSLIRSSLPLGFGWGDGVLRVLLVARGRLRRVRVSVDGPRGHGTAFCAAGNEKRHDSSQRRGLERKHSPDQIQIQLSREMNGDWILDSRTVELLKSP